MILHILWKYATHSDTLDRSMEFGALGWLHIHDERATLCNMATECSKDWNCEPDDLTVEWLLKDARLAEEDSFSCIS